MPTATPFTALGAGNGYYQCMTKVNVLNRGDGNPYDNYKILDLNEAMHLFWNIASASIAASCPRLVSDGMGGTVEDGTLLAEITSADLLKEPYERVCGTDNVADVDQDNFSFVYAAVYTPPIFRLYYGDVSDEGNFIGYSVGRVAEADAEYVLDQRKLVYYLGLIDFDNSTTLSDVTVGGVTLFKYELIINNSNDPLTVSAAISDVGFYT